MSGLTELDDGRMKFIFEYIMNAMSMKSEKIYKYLEGEKIRQTITDLFGGNDGLMVFIRVYGSGSFEFSTDFPEVIRKSSQKHLQTVTNYYIVNMAFADSATAIFVMPLKLTELTAPCHISIVIFHKVVCQITQYIIMILVFTSLITVVVISIERYIVIVHPFNARFCQSKTKTKSIIFGTWLLPIIVCFPILLNQTTYANKIHSEFGTISRLICQDVMSASFRRGYISSFIILFYVIPLIIIIFTSLRIIWKLLRPIEIFQLDQSRYHLTSQSQNVSLKREENKRKVAKMMMVITFLYFISWSPFYLMQVAALTSNVLNDKNFYFIFILIHMISFINSMCNPIVYYFMSEKLRHAFQCIILECFRKPLPVSRNIQTSNQSLLTQRQVNSRYRESYSKKNDLYYSESVSHKLRLNDTAATDYV